jgi:hypothetical protein
MYIASVIKINKNVYNLSNKITFQINIVSDKSHIIIKRYHEKRNQYPKDFCKFILS